MITILIMTKHVHFSIDTIDPFPTFQCRKCKFRSISPHVRDAYICMSCHASFCHKCMYTLTLCHRCYLLFIPNINLLTPITKFHDI